MSVGLPDKKKLNIGRFIYPVALLILPLLKINQGFDVSDSMYSLGNYMFSDRLDGMWVMSTYLSNLAGSLIMKLPGADRLVVANLYTGLVLSCTALIVYFVLKEEVGESCAFLGEFTAVSMCWIPTGILYNYLTYLLLTVGALLLWKAIVSEKKHLFFLAGVVLGSNVFVRIPNVTQAMLIAVLVVTYILWKKQGLVKAIFICIGGYVTGVMIPLLMLIARYGISGLGQMINGLMGITSTDESYTPLSMITDTLKAYGRSLKWVALILLVTACGMLMFRILPGRYEHVKRMIYLAVLALMIRFFWGRGMFSFRYYEDYTSIYEWGMMALFMSIAVDLIVIFSKKYKKQLPLALISLVIIMIAPLGSNNNTYQNLNNMFLVMPLTFCICIDIIKTLAISGVGEKDHVKAVRYIKWPVATGIILLLICILVQSFGFGRSFVFRDGMRGEKRDTRITGVPCLEGIFTNEAKASDIEGLYEYMDSIEADEVILYGDCPGLTYVLERPSAIFTSWADLDSNSIEDVDEALINVSTGLSDSYQVPVIIRNIEFTSINSAVKMDLIADFIAMNQYELSYSNDEYKVYTRP